MKRTFNGWRYFAHNLTGEIVAVNFCPHDKRSHLMQRYAEHWTDGLKPVKPKFIKENFTRISKAKAEVKSPGLFALMRTPVSGERWDQIREGLAKVKEIWGDTDRLKKAATAKFGNRRWYDFYPEGNGTYAAYECGNQHNGFQPRLVGRFKA